VRLKGYGKAVWYNRVADLRHGLDSPDWVLGTSRQLEVVDPSPAQMVQHGFFNLRDHSHNAAGSVSIDFIKAMVKHGFLMLGGVGHARLHALRASLAGPWDEALGPGSARGRCAPAALRPPGSVLSREGGGLAAFASSGSWVTRQRRR
jgi:hypothetical protein